MAEIGVISQQGLRSNTSKDNRNQDRAAGPMFKGTAHFFDRKHDTGQGRVESRSHSCRPAGENKAFFQVVAREVRKPAQRVHDRCTDLYCWAFTTY